MRHKLAFLAIALTLLLSACTMNRPVCATSNPLGNKTGVYVRKSFLFFPSRANTDAAIQKAAENGGITRISTVDYNVTFFLFFTEYRTIVRGE
ncbi:MAG: protein trl (tRNA-associated locus protein) [Candidatus Cloacimonetes bacterium]|nr:protein trl (tRNA-associated locus protein) [Candidatus Cloacimonadota bacterium]MDD2360964.1 TRL domain-containing protein [Syntrophaceticus schinkii]HOA28884.1 TRL domain-containing protein [Candidatus Cloacimonadota bacterium]HOH60361.1 TRL domain-containing protein [Candidatus Cloacimonadota bacterium]HPI25572.1 TRL domain-containing protein [Candidatus Cloacimonadota bacterium]